MERRDVVIRAVAWMQADGWKRELKPERQYALPARWFHIVENHDDLAGHMLTS